MEFRIKPSMVREGRKAKQRAKEGGVHVKGVPPKIFGEKISPQIDERIEEVVAEQRFEFEKAWFQISETFNFEFKAGGFEDLIPVFKQTLKKRAKLYGRTSIVTLEDLATNKRKFEDFFNAALHDFLLSLKTSLEGGETYKTAVEIASLTHWINPRDLHRLKRVYEVGEGILKTALVKDPRDPDGFIIAYINRRNMLEEKYGDKIDKSVIAHFALRSPKDPEAALKKYKQSLTRLRKKYAENEDVEEYVIKRALVDTPSAPGVYINKYLRRYRKLREDYQDKHVDPDVLRFAALNYPQKAKQFIDWHKKTYNTVVVQTSHKPWMVKQALRRNAFKSPDEIKRILREEVETFY